MSSHAAHRHGQSTIRPGGASGDIDTDPLKRTILKTHCRSRMSWLALS